MRSAIGTDSKDKGVAAVIGALLLASMGVTLFASFTLWYVPTTTDANVQNSFNSQSAAFITLSQQLSSDPFPGKVVTQSIPLGIEGAPPFSQATQTQLFFNQNRSEFSGHLNFSFRVELQNTTGSSTGLTFNTSYDESFSFGGIIASNLKSPGGFQSIFYEMGGSAFLSQQGGQPYVLYGSPLTESNTTQSGVSNLSLSMEAISFLGTNVSVSDIGSSILSMQSVFSNNTEFSVGDNLSLLSTSQTPYSAVISNITLTGLNYTFAGSFAKSINTFLHGTYGAGSTVTNGNWTFSNFPLNATATGSGNSYAFNLYLYNGKSVSLNSLSILISQFKILSL